MPMSGPSLEESLSKLSVDQRKSFPAPPRLHWLILFVIGVCLAEAGAWLSQISGLPWLKGVLSPEFVVFAWLLVQASFVQRLIPNTHFLFTSMIAGCVAFGPILLRQSGRLEIHGWESVLPIIGAFMLLADLFRMRTALERHYNLVEPYGLSMPGVLLFFLGPFYLQYHLRNIALWKDQQANSVTQ
jgi:hypothetical protein